MCINAGLVDEMQICYIPVILGSGIPLFPSNPKESNWELRENIAYASGIIKLSYRLLR
jgi:dihydrofolate reductase